MKLKEKKKKEKDKEMAQTKLVNYQVYLFNDLFLYACKDSLTSKVTSARQVMSQFFSHSLVLIVPC